MDDSDKIRPQPRARRFALLGLLLWLPLLLAAQVAVPPRSVALTNEMGLVPVAASAQTAPFPPGLSAGHVNLAQLQAFLWEPAPALPHPSTGQPSLPSFEGCWYRLRLYNAETAAASYTLWLQSRGYLSDVHIFVVQGGQGRPITASDLDLPQVFNSIVFPLRLEAGQQADVYFHSRVHYLTPVVATTSAYLQEYSGRQATQYILLAYFGMAFIMVVYNGLLWLSLRDHTYGWYMLYLLCFWAFVTLESGVFAPWLAFKLHFYYQYLANTLSAIFFLAIIRFSQSFLRLPELLPRAMPWVRVGYALNLISIAWNSINLFVWPAPELLYDLVEQTATLYTTLLGLTLAIWTWHIGYRPARYFLLAFAVLGLSAIIFVGIQFGLVPLNPLTINSLYVGSGLEFALLSLALGDRYNLVKAEKVRERERISRDLHDNVGAQLAAVLYGLQLSEPYIKDNPELGTRCKALQQEVRSTMTQLRETIWALHHHELTLEQLAHHIRDYALRQLQHQPNPPEVAVVCEADAARKLGAVQSLELFRIAQEALHNALKYAGCHHLTVVLAQSGRQLVLRVEDDGRGLPDAVLRHQAQPSADHLPDLPPNASHGLSGFGLENMRRRAELLGGVLRLANRAQGGSLVEVRISADAVTADRLLRAG